MPRSSYFLIECLSFLVVGVPPSVRSVWPSFTHSLTRTNTIQHAHSTHTNQTVLESTEEKNHIAKRIMLHLYAAAAPRSAMCVVNYGSHFKTHFSCEYNLIVAGRRFFFFFDSLTRFL